MIFKSIAAEIEDVSQKEGIVTAAWSAFGNEDSDGDIIEKGAYAKTIRQRGPEGSNRIKVLWQHDWTQPIGRPLDLTETDTHLVARFKIAGTQTGRDALILYNEGVITEHSVGIDILQRREEDRRRIPEVRLWEGSPVTWGANALTPTLEIKGSGKSAFDLLTEQTERMRRALKTGISDELASDLEGWLVTLDAHLAQIKAKLAAPETSPLDSTGDDPSHWMQGLENHLDLLNQAFKGHA